MIKLNGQLRVTGESGRHYFFNLHFFHPAHKPHIEDKQGIYIFIKKKNSGKYDTIYAAQTTNLVRRINQLNRGNCIFNKKPNRVCILAESSKELRISILEDILANPKYEFRYNELLADIL